jgi:hypothetical protein
MSRKRLLLFALPAVVAALAVAGVALAGAGGPGEQAATATFSATTVAHARLSTCSVNGGDTFASTLGTYTGTSSGSDARLDGTLTIHALSFVDTNTGLGRIVGTFRVKPASGPGAVGAIDAAVTSGNANGAVTARLQGPPIGRMVATFTSPFDPATGFSSASLGTGSVAAAGVVVSGGGWCHPWHRHPLRWLHRHLRHGR